MFSPAKIRHVTLLVPKQGVDSFMLKLHAKGLCQIKQSERVPEEQVELFRLNSDVKGVRDRLYKHQPAVGNIGKMLFPRPAPKVVVEKRGDEEIIGETRTKFEKLKAGLETSIDGLDKKKQGIEEKIELLKLFPPQMDFAHLRRGWEISAHAGLVRAQNEVELKKLPGVKVLSPVDKKTLFIAVYTTMETEEKTLAKLHEMGFEELELPAPKGTPEQVRRELKKKLGQVRDDMSKERARLRALWESEHQKIDALTEEIEIVTDRAKAETAVETGYAIARLEAWVPEKNWGKFKALVKRSFKEHYIVPEERDDAPTLLENPQPIKAYELITGLYGLPKYGMTDPTPILAFTFALFFGFMLTDAVYGIVLALLGLLLVGGIGRVNEGMKNFGVILAVNGLFTAMLGALFGSWAGSLVTEWLNIPFWIDPMKEAMIVLIISLVIGFIHLTSGYLIGVKDKRKSLLAVARPSGVMLMMMIGIVFIVLSMMGMGYLQMVGIGLILLSVVVNFVAAYKQDGPIMSALSIFDFTGWLGDWFSYARLMSLALGTAGIALAVNFMAGMMGEMVPIVGPLVAAVILIGGHAFNLGVNALGSFVHSLRLHFLEFFSKFYDAGGVAYQPFYAKRKLTEVK
ncbi:V-type ATP synthase subunit I [archaeon]